MQNFKGQLAILKANMRFTKILNCVFKNHFYKLYILKSLFLKLQIQTDP